MTIQLEIDGALRRVQIEQGNASCYTARIDDGPAVEVEAVVLRPGVLSLQIAGRSYRCVLEESPEGPAVHLAAQRLLYRVDDPRSLKSRRSRHAGADGPKTITAPMPGRVVRIAAKAGDAVEAHQAVLVIEAMKMQNELKSPKAGKVIEIRVAEGATVAAGEVLAVVE